MLRFCAICFVVSLFSFSAYADVLEFKTDGSVVSHVARDYRHRVSSVVYTHKMPVRAKEKFTPYIEAAAKKYGVETGLIEAVILAESSFNPAATSHKGAMGLMQLMPGTAKDLGVSDAYDPKQNIEGGVKYLKGLLDTYDGDRQLALAAYNAGPEAVNKYNGIPPYRETQNYVRKIEAVLFSSDAWEDVGQH